MNGFAFISSLMTTLTQKSVKFELLEAGERSVQTFKGRLTSAIVLILLGGYYGFCGIL